MDKIAFAGHHRRDYSADSDLLTNRRRARAIALDAAYGGQFQLANIRRQWRLFTSAEEQRRAERRQQGMA
ncbi:MAG: hypothetical protein Tsb002_25640 [Wenzhouxiangellaceae bacterium]